MTATLYYFHDPMCSWCWGFKPTWQKVKDNLPPHITQVNVLGGLAPDSDVPMPESMQQMLESTWHRIHQQLGTSFNFSFWTDCQPRRSTYPACRAVLAAAEQGFENEIITAIQEGYYLNACNPSDVDVLTGFARQLGLDIEMFKTSMKSPELNKQLMDQISFFRSMPANGFPSMVLVDETQIARPIGLDYQSADNILSQIDEALG